VFLIRVAQRYRFDVVSTRRVTFFFNRIDSEFRVSEVPPVVDV